MGTPQELTDNDGNVVWANYEYAWGGSYQSYYKEQPLNNCVILETELQPIRFQGQFFDTETSLHYNRFRYYDSDVGMFISRDPIGLLGGINIFQYADNPVMWIDPLGLKELYYLTATKDGFYPVYEYGKKNPVGKIYLRKGEIWKIGETKNIKNGQQKRYSTSWLINNNLEYKTKMKGLKKNMQKFEKAKLKKYFKKFGRLPAGNKCFH